MNEADIRRQIGDRILVGKGFEFGAGLSPSNFANIKHLTVIDKLDPKEFREVFGENAPYDIRTFSEALAESIYSADFITAHHVLEHIANPIKILADWLSLVRTGGSIYLSVPSSNNACERHREVTPISHILADFLNDADGRDFESRQHIPGFINQWASMDPKAVWYAQMDVQTYIEWVQIENKRVEGHDLHWHTYSIETFRQVVEAAFYIAGMNFYFTDQIETSENIFIGAIRVPGRSREPVFINEFVTATRNKLKRLQKRRFSFIR